MEGPSIDELSEQYKQWTSEELVSLFQRGSLTAEAQEVVSKELAARGIPTPELKVTAPEETLKTHNGNVRVPASLQVIAVLFLLGGVASVLDMVRWYLQAPGIGLYVNVGIVGFLIGRGLLRGLPIWRTVALVAIVLGLAGTIAAIVMAIVLPFFVHLRFEAGYYFLAFVIPGSFGLVLFWAYRVLQRADIKAFFSSVSEETREATPSVKKK